MKQFLTVPGDGLPLLKLSSPLWSPHSHSPRHWPVSSVQAGPGSLLQDGWREQKQKIYIALIILKADCILKGFFPVHSNNELLFVSVCLS